MEQYETQWNYCNLKTNTKLENITQTLKDPILKAQNRNPIQDFNLASLKSKTHIKLRNLIKPIIGYTKTQKTHIVNPKIKIWKTHHLDVLLMKTKQNKTQMGWVLKIETKVIVVIEAEVCMRDDDGWWKQWGRFCSLAHQICSMFNCLFVFSFSNHLLYIIYFRLNQIYIWDILYFIIIYVRHLTS